MKISLGVRARRAACAVGVITGVLLASTAGTARPAFAATCPPPPTPLQPFASWADATDYVLSTGGSFEPGSAAWTLTGGATVLDGDNAPNAFDPSTHSRALYLPAGASATSACVTAPHILGIVRMFAKSAGVATGQLKVEVLVKGGVYPAGTTSPGARWAPTPVLTSTAPNYKGAVTYQVRLTALGGAFTVDDVYVDPHASR